MRRNNLWRGISILPHTYQFQCLPFYSISKSRQQEIASLESSIRKLSRRRSSSSSDEEEAKKKKAKGPSILAQELAKYRTKTTVKEKGKKKDEGDVLAVLSSFRSKLKGSTIPEPDPTDMDEDKDPEAEGMEVDSDAAFLRHTLTFPKDDGSESARAEHDYEVIDPRERGRRAKEEEKEKRAQKNRGGRGRR
jgi:peptidyl-prolyl cis-trans isomerase SDCCAG10